MKRTERKQGCSSPIRPPFVPYSSPSQTRMAIDKGDIGTYIQVVCIRRKHNILKVLYKFICISWYTKERNNPRLVPKPRRSSRSAGFRGDELFLATSHA